MHSNAPKQREMDWKTQTKIMAALIYRDAWDHTHTHTHLRTDTHTHTHAANKQTMRLWFKWSNFSWRTAWGLVASTRSLTGTNQRRETTDTHRRENKVWGESLLLCVHIKIRHKKLRKQLRQQQHCGDSTKRLGSCDSWRPDAVNWSSF